MKKIGFIVETEEGDSLAYSVIVPDECPEKDCWGIGMLNGFEYVPADSKVIRFELESEEVIA